MSIQPDHEESWLKAAYWVAGPTASGKSALAIALARRLGAEIISVDSMQVYRGLDIGTAKPTQAEQSDVRHHMIDVAEMDEVFDVARFCREAVPVAHSIIARGRTVLFCGGTGFYFQGLIHGVGHGPPRDQAMRQAMEARPLEDLVEELRRVDPVSANRVDLNNRRRVQRALEVFHLTGKSFVSFASDWKRPSAVDTSRFWVLEYPAEVLRKRIEQRVDQMMHAGWLEEVRGLVPKGLVTSPTAGQAIGYRTLCQHLEGKMPLQEAVELIKLRTCQFAKRQRTWFRQQATGLQVPMSGAAPDQLADHLLKA